MSEFKEIAISADGQIVYNRRLQTSPSGIQAWRMEQEGSGKLKAVGCAYGQPRDFCYDSAEPAVPQTFLETDEDRLLVARLDIEPFVLRELDGRDC